MSGLLGKLVNWLVPTLTSTVVGFLLNSITTPLLTVYNGGATYIVYEVLKATYPIPDFEGVTNGLYSLGYTVIGFIEKIYNLLRDLLNPLRLFDPTYMFGIANSLLGLTLSAIQFFQSLSTGRQLQDNTLLPGNCTVIIKFLNNQNKLPY